MAKETFEPVIVVQDAAELEGRLRARGIPFESTFVATPEEAQGPRRDLVRFVRAELKRADRARAQKLRQILQKERAYLWHCGGFERSGGRYLHCSFVRHQDGSGALREPRFPAIKDGGTDVATCNFSLKAGQIVNIDWNGEA